MEYKYTKLNIKSLKGEILIASRTKYIELIAKDFLLNKIIPIEYIDKQITLENIKNNTLIIDDELRLKFIIVLLSKECIKGTAHIIANLCS
jgi:hypothetical protein